ncbi:adenylate cyclase type 10-like [Choristoneura fumiferana]|uniref:adenylate cyclase type 10-like n=1 Tax=Choristoneura fumiferana TaxID=7141 RepID=UPI003D15E041
MTNNSPKRRKGRKLRKIEFTLGVDRDSESLNFKRLSPRTEHERNFFREFSLRPAVVSAIRSTWWPTLRQFMVKPVLRAVDNDEPMEFLAEVRRVVIVFLNIITKSVSEELLIHIVDTAYKIVCSVSSSSGGLVNKVSMFDKDMMFLVVFGLRGLKHEDEAQKALLCALTLKESLNDPNIISVSIGLTSGTTYCGVVGHVLRREYTVIGSAVNKAARLMMVYPSKITCDKETFLRSKLDQEFFRLLEPKPLKGILKPGPVYEFNKLMWPQRSSCWRHPILGRNAEIRKYKMTLLNALKQQHQKFTRYRDHVYGVVFLGPDAVGKTRLVEECIAVTPKCIQVYRIRLTQAGKSPYGMFRQIMTAALAGSDAGAVMPPPSLLNVDQPIEYDNLKDWMESCFKLQESNVSLGDPLHKIENRPPGPSTDNIQMAVLADSYNFEDMKVDMTMDAVILKTYDSLTPFEKMLLKCSSVLGDVFSRRMLQHVLKSDSPRKVAQAVAKLFLIRVLECEGGDFTRDGSMVLVHPAPAPVAIKPPYCACLGVRHLPDCRDLPAYAFCGYMKFKYPLFRSTTYDLLTDSQKHEMHARALLYLERYTLRCIACGAGCFTRLLGERCDDFLCLEIIRLRQSAAMYRKEKHVRSFSSLEMASCECLSILLSVYCQFIDHCRGAGEYEKLFEAYLEYAELCVMNNNIPQAIRLLFEVEAIARSEKYCTKLACKISWFKNYRLGRILSLRGACMLESGDMTEARKHLLHALELYSDPFPTTKFSMKLYNAQLSMRQVMLLYVAPQRYEATESGLAGLYYEEVAETLNRLYKMFCECKDDTNASLAAKWAFDYALRSGANFKLLCEAFGNMITLYRKTQKFSKCLRLEKRAMELCHRKRGQLDTTEVRSVCFLYTSLFLFYVEYGKKNESLEFGLSVMHMITNQTELNTRHLLILWMLKMLLTDLRIADMVVLMREFFYLTDHYDLSSMTWYHFYSMVILLDTGFCVESYQTCEKFYIKKGDAILRSKNPDSAWYFFVSMWLMTIRIGAWERTILWEDKIKQVTTMDFKEHEFNLLLLVRLVEGLLIMLVREIDNRNIKKIVILEKTVKNLFQDMNNSSQMVPMYRPRFFLLYAYYHYIRGKKFRAFSYLNKTFDLAKQYSHGTMLIWAEHTRKHWKGILNPALVDYWVDHVEPENLLDYRDFNPAQGKQIVPYTLPLPRDFEK